MHFRATRPILDLFMVQLILIKIRNTVDEIEKRDPWIGEVTKITLTSVHFEWMVKTQDGLWKCGLVSPSRERTTLINIIAKFKYDRSQEMPDQLYEKLCSLSGISK